MERIELKQHKTGIWIQVLIILVLTLVIFFAGYYQPGKSCTIFTAVQGETVLYGNSEDQHNPDPMIGFFPPSSEGYGSVHFGTRSKDGQINFEGAVNDQGLAWDINSTPHSKLIPESNPHKPYYLSEDNFLTRITKKASSVEQAMRIAGLYDFGDEMLGQIHIADASGDAVVISGGPDSKIAFTRKEPGDGYHLSTNFNLAIPEKGPVDFRWETAGSMLEGLIDGEELNPEYALSILEAVKLRSITSLTLYSNVLDLKNNKIYLHYMSQFNEVAVIEMEKEFTKGRRVVEMRELFSPETAAAGDANYESFANRFFVIRAVVIAVGILLILGMVFLIARKVQNKKANSA